MKHISKEEKKWAYDRWCEGWCYSQIAEALDLTTGQVSEALRPLPRIRPILHYTPKGEEKNAKEIIMQMATEAINARLKGEKGYKAFNKEQQERYGKEILSICTALYNAGYRKDTKR
jgi:hypothetical protein